MLPMYNSLLYKEVVTGDDDVLTSCLVVATQESSCRLK
jgi:hypothetical protein